MTQRDDQPTHDLRNLEAGQETPGTVKTQETPDTEISNVDLQFMGRPDPRREIAAEAHAEAKLADEFQERGMDKQDVASAGSMIASDPASTTPGDDTSEDTDTR